MSRWPYSDWQNIWSRPLYNPRHMKIDARLSDVIERLNSEEEQRQAETFRFMEEQKIKKALGLPLWEELKAKLREDCDFVAKSSPVRLNVAAHGAYALTLTNVKDGRTIELIYNRDVPCVLYKIPSGSGRLTFRVAADGNSVGFVQDEIPKSLDDLSVFFTRCIVGR